MISPAPDVVVCGAGVAGLATACALGRLGLRVLILDKQPQIRPIPKGEVFQPGAFEALRSWGVLSRLAELGALRMSQLITRDESGTALMTLDYGRLLPPASGWLSTHDYATILRAFVDRLPDQVQLRRGVLVRGMLRDDAGRVAGVAVTDQGRELDVPAGLVVAADGVSSRLRKEAGLHEQVRAYPHRLLTMELSVPHGSVEGFNAVQTARGLRLYYPLPGDRLRLYVQVGPRELAGLDRDAMRRWGDGVLAGAPALAGFAEEMDAALDRRQILPVGRFVAGRLAVPGLVLVGEAAHCVHPMAAQGMSSSVADAVLLAEVLSDLIARGWGDHAGIDQALATYHARRLPALAHVARMSHRATRMITRASRAQHLLSRRVVVRTGDNPRLLHLMAYNLAGLGIRPLRPVDALYQLGVLPDPRAHLVGAGLPPSS